MSNLNNQTAPDIQMIWQCYGQNPQPFLLLRSETNENGTQKLDYIGKQAFYACKSLKSISIPTGVRTIDMQTFASCILLRNVTLPSTVTTIDQGAFEMCLSLSSINLPANLEEISANAFYFCDVLDNITIPSKVKFIGDYAFEDCASLSKINIPASVKSIGNNAFSRCGKIASITVASGNAAYCTENGALYTKDMFSLLLYPAKASLMSFLISVVLPAPKKPEKMSIFVFFSAMDVYLYSSIKTVLAIVALHC